MIDTRKKKKRPKLKKEKSSEYYNTPQIPSGMDQRPQ
jgi:hypothetical protein